MAYSICCIVIAGSAKRLLMPLRISVTTASSPATDAADHHQIGPSSTSPNSAAMCSASTHRHISSDANSACISRRRWWRSRVRSASTSLPRAAMGAPMLWGYFFTDESQEKLAGLVPGLEAQGFRFVEFFEPDLEEGEEPYWFLHEVVSESRAIPIRRVRCGCWSCARRCWPACSVFRQD